MNSGANYALLHSELFAAKFQIPTFQQLDAGARQRLVDNIAGSLGNALPRIQNKMVQEFAKVNSTFGQMLQSALSKNSMPY